MKIKEIMTSDVITVKEDMLILDVAKLISEHKIHAVPVIDDERKVLGIITETDFFTKDSATEVYIPSLIHFIQSGKMGYPEGDSEDISKILVTKAKDIMSVKCENISPEMELEDFFKLIKEKSFNSYCVVDESGVLVGIMTIADAIKLI